jgi:VWFA-related protein
MSQRLNHLDGKTRRDPRRRRWVRRLPGVVAMGATIAAAVVALSAQPEPQGPTFRGRIDLVNVGVTVTGKKQRLVTDLGATDFAVFEDGKPQQIFAFGNGQEPGPPLHVGVLLDVSGSQQLDLGFTQSAVIKFLASLPEAADMTFIDFASHVRGGRYTQDEFPRLVERIRHLRADGYTRLYDALGLYLSGAREQDGRKVVVLYTDGGDTQSSLSLGELMRLLKESEVIVYAIGALYNQPQAVQFPQRALLATMADATGGMAFFPMGIKDLDKIYEQVLGEVQAQYTIGYVSTNQKSDGKWRKIKIKVTRDEGKGLKVRARKGYYAPSVNRWGEEPEKTKISQIQEAYPQMATICQGNAAHLVPNCLICDPPA